jgi:DNA invertase Pin-like site-specific DNA recombinase
MKKAVGYCRVSTDGQVGEDKFGIDSQKEQILEYAKRNDYEILEWFIDE